jgi:hydrogenase expression/formation protein HypC
VCLAVPGKVVQIDGRCAQVEFGGGLLRETSLDVLPDTELGDYVLIHAGYAISKLDQQEAEETLQAIREMGDLGD